MRLRDKSKVSILRIHLFDLVLFSMKSKATPSFGPLEEWSISILNGNASMNKIGPQRGPILYLAVSNKKDVLKIKSLEGIFEIASTRFNEEEVEIFDIDIYAIDIGRVRRERIDL
jgi:hypothetical protein